MSKSVRFPWFYVSKNVTLQQEYMLKSVSFHITHVSKNVKIKLFNV